MIAGVKTILRVRVLFAVLFLAVFVLAVAVIAESYSAHDCLSDGCCDHYATAPCTAMAEIPTLVSRVSNLATHNPQTLSGDILHPPAI